MSCTVIGSSLCNIDWSATGSMIGGISAALGLFSIWHQLSLSRKANQAQAEAAIAQAEAAKIQTKSRLFDLSAPINRALLDNPDICSFTLFDGGGKLPEKGSENWHKLMLICSMQASYIEYLMNDIEVLDPDEQSGWRKYAEDVMNRPGFNAYWEARKSWYDPKMQEFIKTPEK